MIDIGEIVKLLGRQKIMLVNGEWVMVQNNGCSLARTAMRTTQLETEFKALSLLCRFQ
jgi:hypothetical protein